MEEEFFVEDDLETNKQIDSNKPETQILGGFFIYRVKPSTENPTFDEAMNETSPTQEFHQEEEYEGEGEGEELNLQFGGGSSLQTSEVVGIVLIKQYGTRVYLSYSPIDVEKEKIGDFMIKFADTSIGNQADNNRSNVFEFDSIDKLIEKLTYQKSQNKLFQKPLLTQRF